MTDQTETPTSVYPGPYLPPWVPPAGDLNEIAEASRTAQEVAAPSTPLPVVYGTDRVPGKIAVVHVDDVNGFMYLGVLWCTVSDSITAVYVDGVLTSDGTEGLVTKGGTVENHAAGDASGQYSTLLNGAIAGYTDRIQACYTALKIPKAYARSFPRVEAIVKGKKLYDPRTGQTVWSENPVLAARDIAVGAGWSVNDTYTNAAATWVETTIGGVAARTVGITIAQPRPPEDWMKAFRVYTGCFMGWENGALCLIPDKAEVASYIAATITSTDIMEGSLTIRRRSPLDMPTVCIVEYREATGGEYRAERAVYDSGLSPARTSRIRLPGVTRYAQAYREAVERIKKLQNDVSVELTVFDEGLKLQVGSVVSVSHPVGLSANEFRVVALANDQGRWRLTLTPYDATVYSTDAPTYTGQGGTTLGNPSSPVYANVTGLLTNESHTVAADENGANYVLTGSGGTFKVWNGTTEVTGSGPTYSVQGTNPVDGLTMTINPSSGVYSLSGASWTGAQATFTLRAVYGGVTIDRVYSISKSNAGDPGTGTPGYNTATLTAYKRSSSAPGDTPGQLTYTFSTAAWTPANDWSKTVPATDGNPLYARSATAYSTSAQDTIEIVDWSSATLILQDGTNGTNGLNVATVYLYQRTATSSPPASLPTASHDYTFSSGAVSALPDQGWTATIPAFSGTNPYLWVTLATASSQSATDTITSGEWQTARLLSQNGTDGAAGLGAVVGVLSNEAHVFSAASTGAVSSYTGSGTEIRVYQGTTLLDYDDVGTANGKWAIGTPTVSNITCGTHSSTGVTPNRYATIGDHSGVANGTDVSYIDYPITGKGTDGTSFSFTLRQTFSKSKAGADGTAAKVLAVTPSGQTFKYNSSGVLIEPTTISFSATQQGSSATINWRTEYWNGSTWVATGTNRMSPTTGASSSLAETAFATEAKPALRVYAYFTDGSTYSDSVTVTKLQDGADGASGSAGYNSATLTAYKRNSSQPSDTPGTLTYTFSTAAWTPANNWSKTIPAADGNPCWARSASAYSQSATDQIDTGEWSAATLILQDGTDGSDGLNVATAFIYQRTVGSSAPTLPSVSATYTFGTGDITGLNNGWADTIPAFDGDNPYLWVSTATASNTASTDSIASGEWAAAQQMAHASAGKSMSVYADRQVVTYDSTGALNPASQPTIFSVSKTNTSVTPTWLIERNDGTVLDASTYFEGTTVINRMLRSQEFDNASWTKRSTHVVTTANATAAPDGTTTADLITATSGVSSAGLYQESSTAGNAQYTASIWLKAGSLTSASLVVKDRATDTVRGTLSITMTGEWQRFSVTGTTAGASTGVRVEFGGVGTGTFYAWGAQCVTGSTAENYIPTVAAAVTGRKSEYVTLTEAEFDTARSTSLGVGVTASLTDYSQCLFDKVRLLKVQDGAAGANGVGGITGILSNEAHVFPATSAGAVSSYTGSGTQIRVYQGATLLDYDDVGTANGTWAIGTPTVSNITCGTHSSTGSSPNRYATIGDHTGVANGTDTSSIDYPITGKGTDGTSFSFTLRQTFSKSKAGADGTAAKALAITPTSQTFKYDKDGALIAPSSIVFSSLQQGSSATINWRTEYWTGSAWAATGTNRMSPTTGASSTLTEAGFAAEGDDTLRVYAYFTDGSTYSDSVTVAKVTDGAPGITSMVESSNGFAWSRAINAGSWSPATTTATLTFRFYKAGVQIASRTATSTLNTSTGALTLADGSSTGEATTIAFTNNATAAASATVTHTASGTKQAAQVTSTQGGNNGADGSDGLSIAELAIYRRNTSAPSTPTGGSYDFGTQVLTAPTNWSSGVPAGNDPVYVSRGVAAVTGTTGTDSSITWSAPVLFTQEGAGVDIVFTRSASQPSTPSPSSGVPSGWESDVASVTASPNPLWSSVGTRSNAGQNWTWQTPIRVEGDGAKNLTPPSHLTIPIASTMGVWVNTSTLANAAVINSQPGPFGEYAPMFRFSGDGTTAPGWYAAFRADFAVRSDRPYIHYAWARKRTTTSAAMYGGWSTTPGVVASGTPFSVSNITAANPIVVTTSTAHGLPSSGAAYVAFRGLTGGFTSLNGTAQQITYINTTQFSIAVNGTGWAASSGGQVMRNDINHYFASAYQSYTSTDTNKWYLLVGVINPYEQAYSSVPGPDICGVWDPETGQRVLAGSAYVYHCLPTTSSNFVRHGFYNLTTTQAVANGVDILPVGTWEMDGSQPTKEQILNAGPVYYYIKAPSGTAFLNNGGANLTLEARRVASGGDVLLASGNIQLYDGATPLGYSTTITPANVTGSKVYTLKDGSTTYDSITIVDVTDGTNGTDGDDAVACAVEASNGLAWTRAINAGSWTPSGTTTDLTFTFYRAGASIATRVVRATLNTSTGTISSSNVSSSGEATTYATTNNTTTAMTVTATHTASGVKAAETVMSSQGGNDGADGADSKYVIVTGQQTISPNGSASLSAALFGGLTVYDWEYWTGSAWTNLSGTQNTQTYTLTATNAAWGDNTTLRVRCLSQTSPDIYDEITVIKLPSQAQNLLVNGNTEYGNAFNFPELTFVSTGGYDGGGYLSYINASTPDTNFSVAPLYVDADAKYKFSVYRRVSPVNGTNYIGFNCYTENGTQIQPYQCWRIPKDYPTDSQPMIGTLYETTNGSGTTIKVTPISGMTYTQFSDALNNTAFSGSTPLSALGVQWSALSDNTDLPSSDATYLGSCTISNQTTYWQISCANTVPARTAGVAMAFTRSGSTYQYVISGAFSTSWVNEWAVIGGLHDVYRAPSSTQFRIGTKYIRAMYWKGSGGSGTSRLDVDNWQITALDSQLAGYLTNETHAAPSNSDGSSPVYTEATGNFKVFFDGEDVTSACTFSTLSNPQSLTRGGSGSLINSSGNYLIDGGFDENTATVTFRATYAKGSFTQTIDKVFTLVKAKAGAAGADGLTLTLSTTAFSVSCDSAGNPVSGALTNAVGQVTVYSGSTDVTASASYSSTNSGCTGSVSNTAGTKGAYSITVISANTGYLEITVTYSGKTIKGRFTVTKVRAGTASASQADTSLTINNASTYTSSTVHQGGPMTIPVGPNGTIYCSVSHGYSAPSTAALTGKFQYSATPGSNSWTDIDVEYTDPNPATLNEPSSLDFSKTLSGPAAAANWEFRYINRRANSVTLSNNGSQNFTVYWSP